MACGVPHIPAWTDPPAGPALAVPPDPILRLTRAELETLVERAAEEGARKALERIGLHDDDAPGDVRDLRGLLEAWRDARRTAWATIIKAATTVLLAALAAGVWVQWFRR